MSRKKKTPRTVIEEQPPEAASPPQPAQPPRRPLSRGKKWLFLFICLVVLPLLGIGFLEVLLRIVGYGFAPGFFLERTIGGKQVLVDNARFGWRFFPPTIARRPHDFLIPAEKSADTCRLFLFGESAAWGDPDPSFGMARILEKLLADQYPGTRFEVVNGAMAAISSHVVYQIAEDAAAFKPDAFIVYMGNNEVIGPFGPGTVFSGFSGNLSFIRSALWLKGLRLSQMLQDFKVTLEGRDKQPHIWAGMQMFEQNKVRSDDPRLPTMYRHFQRNLADIIAAGRKAGADTILCTMAANFGGWGPHASLNKPDLPADRKGEWEKAWTAGKAAESSTSPVALTSYQKAAEIDPTYADLQYRIGRSQMRLGNHSKAMEHFRRAVDEDCLRFRTDSKLNDLIRETAVAEKAPLLDVRKLFEQISPNGIPTLNLLDDHVHMNFEGNYRIACALLPEVARILERTRKLTARDPAKPLALDECARRLAYTRYNERRITERNLQRIKNPPFTAQSDHAEHLEQFVRRLDTLSLYGKPAGMRECVAEYEAAIATNPDDWVLYENLADLYQQLGDSARETEALKRALALMPHHEERNIWLAQSLANQGRLDEAVDGYRKGLRYDPSNTKAYTGLGSVFLRQGKVEDGIEQYRKAVAARPGSPESWNELGEVLYKLDRMDEAQKAFGEAVRLKPDYALACTNLGVISISRGQHPQALDYLNKALQANPEFPPAIRHMGNTLVQLGHYTEAIPYLEKAIPLLPKAEAELRANLAVARQRAGQKP